MVWDPRKITPRSWPEVAVFYRGIEDRNTDFQPLRELAEHVAAQAYASSIGAGTSGTALLVGPVALVTGEDAAARSLRIDLALSGAITLVTPANSGRASSSSTSIAPPRLVDAFERFLRDAGWIDALAR
jgi:hypothetical protein